MSTNNDEISVQNYYSEFCEAKSRAREVRRAVRDAYNGNTNYVRAKEELNAAKEKLKSIKGVVESNLNRELDDIKTFEDEAKSILSAVEVVAVRLIRSGREIKVKDEKGRDMVLKPTVKPEKAHE